MSADPGRADRNDRHRGPRRGPGRFLAPLALIVVIVAVIAIVAGTGGTATSTRPATLVPATTRTTQAGESSKRPRTSTRSATTTSGTTSASATTTTSASSTTTATSTVGTYTIAAGDTFSVIAMKTGVSIAQLETLNPGVSSSALTVGQVIKLK